MFKNQLKLQELTDLENRIRQLKNPSAILLKAIADQRKGLLNATAQTKARKQGQICEQIPLTDTTHQSS